MIVKRGYVVRYLWVIVVVLSLSIVAASMFGFAWLERELRRPLVTQGAPEIIQIPRGASLHSVMQEVAITYQVRYPGIIVQWAKWQKLDRSLKAGEYRVGPNMSVRDLLNTMNRGDVVTYQVTVPEGVTASQALTIIQAQEPVLTTLEGLSDPRLLTLVEPSTSIEGWLLPETYQYVRGDTDFDIVKRAHALMRQTLRAAWADRQADVPLQSIYEALILASIVERETSVASERATIAGVFAQRLKQNMRLQTDPTVIYGLGSEFDGNLTRAHLRDSANLWNTYQHKGLPPTPIALPGSDAIHAVTQPELGDALYFVAKGDGTHVFAATLAEHNENVRRYQLERKVDYRSTPAKPPKGY